MRQPALADTLERIAEHGADELYTRRDRRDALVAYQASTGRR